MTSRMPGHSIPDDTSSRLRLMVFRCTVAVLCVVLGLWMAGLLIDLLDATTVLLGAVVVAAWFGGLTSGIVASVLATLGIDYYFIAPFYTVTPEVGHLPRMAVFALLAASFSAASAARKNAERSLKAARDEMEARVRDRTAELEQANDQLQAEVAERRRAEEALQERANLLDLTHDTVFVRDMSDVITFWNRGAEEQYGWTREEALKRVSHDLLRTVLPAPLPDIERELTRAGRWEGELTQTRRDGTKVVAASRWALRRDEQGRPVSILETNNDVTERKQSEEAIRRQANLLEQTHDAIFVWEFPRRIVYWNRAAEQLYGFSKEEAIGSLGHELLQTQHSMPVPAFEALLGRDGEWTGELTQTTKDGRQIIVDSRHVLLRETEGRQLVLETNRDITDRKRSERALEDLAGRLIYAQEEERSRIGRELHDHVSQRLGILAINIDQLRMHPSTATIAPALEDLRQQTSEITYDIHSLSHRLHSSMLDHLGVIPALQRLVNECGERYGIPIAFTHTPLPAPVASDVALCLFRVAEEGLANISKHSQARAARVDVTSEEGGIRLTVADEGVGFDSRRLETKPGLGFVSMRERLRLVHGTIRVHSAPAQGTTIDVWVPRHRRAG